MSAIQRALLFTDRSLRLRIRDCHSLWCRVPSDFCSEKGCSPPHLPPYYYGGIRFDLTGFLSLILTGSQLVSLPPPTKMLHFGGLLRITALTQISGSKTACVYPERFAACRVGLRAQAKPSTKWRVATYDFLKSCHFALQLRKASLQKISQRIISYARADALFMPRHARLPSLHTPFSKRPPFRVAE